MSGPPPGYNPSESVLQGGTATITPVMGGGGFIGGGGPENVSLLSGGDAARIEGVQGGGKRSRGTVGKLLGARRQRSRSRSRSRQKGGGPAEFTALQRGLATFIQTNYYLKGVMNKNFAVRSNAGIYIIDGEGRVAIHKRAAGKHIGTISTAGGIVDPSDKKKDSAGNEIGGTIAALREAEEEIGYNPFGIVDYTNLSAANIAAIEGLINRNVLVKFYSIGGIEAHISMDGKLDGAGKGVVNLEDNPSHGGEVDTTYDFREFGADPTKIRRIKNGIALVDVAHAIQVIQNNYNTLGNGGSFTCLQIIKAIQEGGTPQQMNAKIRALLPQKARPAPPAGAPARAPPAVAPPKEELNPPETEEEADNELKFLQAIDAVNAPPKPRGPRQKFKAEDAATKAAPPLLLKREPIPTAAPSDPEFDMSGYNDLCKRYIESQMKLWNRYGPKQQKLLEQAIPLKLEKCGLFTSGFLPTTGLDDEQGQEGFDRLAVVLEKDIKKLLFFPSMRGDLQKTRACLSQVKAIPAHDLPAVAVFAPPFLGDNDATNRQQMAEFMNAKLSFGPTSQKELYILTEQTMRNRFRGCGLHRLQQFKVEGPVLNFLEPTYILYPFPRKLRAEDEEKMIGGFLASAAGSQEKADLPASKSKRMVSIVDYFHDGGRGPIAIQPNISVEGTAPRSPFPLLKTRYYGPTKLAIDDDYYSHYEIFDFEQQRPEPGTANDIGQIIVVPLVDKKFRIRSPLPNIIKDWEAAQFTEDEQEFLGTLNLNLDLLKDVFEADASIMGEDPDDYSKKQLAQFMAAMAASKCFTDTALMTYRECEVPRKFMEKVYTYYLLHDNRVSGLSEQALEGQRQQLQLRAATAEEKAVYAQQSAASAIEAARRTLDQYKKAADKRLAAVGAEAEPAPGSDPFKDGAVEKKGEEAAGDAKPSDSGPSGTMGGGGKKRILQSGGMDIALGANPIIYDYMNERLFARKFLYVDKITGVYREGFAEVEADSPEESRELLNQKMAELRREYPNGIFME
jgi:hypothetical protein